MYVLTKGHNVWPKENNNNKMYYNTLFEIGSEQDNI